MDAAQNTLQYLFASSFARYIRVLPTGFQIHSGKILSSLSATILTFRPARTLYQNKKPTCRSLDGIQSLREGRACASCLMRKTCTPQVYLELLSDRVPLRLLLAYTSARNFMLWLSRQREQGLPVENSNVVISIRDRGRWGEIRFISQPSPPNQ